MRTKLVNIGILTLLALAIVALAVGTLSLARPRCAEAQGYSCLVYTEQGCSKYVVASGGELEVQSGGILDVQSGSTFTSGNFTANGNLVVTGTSNLQGNVSDSGGDFTVADNLVVTGTSDLQGNVSDSGGTFTVADNAWVTGTLAVSGTGSFGGNIVLQNDETIANSANGYVTVTVPAAGDFAVSTGNLVVGDGSPSLTLNGEDAYIKGTLEADGPVRFDNGITVGAGDVSISNGLFLPQFTDLTANDGDWITVTTVSLYALDSSGNVTVTLGACAHDGQEVTFIGDDANSIVFNDTNVRTTTGAALTLGQYDVLKWVCQDTEWLEISLATNS